MTGSGAFEASELAKLKAGGACPRCDLSGADLIGAEVAHADFTNAQLGGAVLGDLRGTDSAVGLAD